MINILLPSMGTATFFKESFFPKPLIEIGDMTMLELVIGNFQKVKDRQMIYIALEEDCSKFHLDCSVRLLEKDATVISLKNQTAGALCTALLAIECIDNDNSLIIANSDQIIDVDYNQVIKTFDEQGADAGVITFSSIHPRWSYVKMEDDAVVEVAEKKPLSNRAIAGFYYYRRGHDFVEAAKQAILKQTNLNGKYYVSASYNELILKGKKVAAYEIAKEQYHSFYSPERVKEYEKRINR